MRICRSLTFCEYLSRDQAAPRAKLSPKSWTASERIATLLVQSPPTISRMAKLVLSTNASRRSASE